MSYAIIGLAFVLLIVFVLLAAKTWHWINVLFLVLTFLAGLGACLGLAKTFELHRQAKAEAYRQKANAERLQQEANEEIYGSSESTTYAPDSLRGISEALALELAGRGRVWFNGTVEAKDANRLFKFAAGAPDDGGDQGAMQGIVLHAFADGNVEDRAYPVNYIGRFRVVAETADSAELEPLFLANEDEFNQPTSSWTLFEKMPADRRDAFKKVENMLGDDFDITRYRELLMTKYLPASLLGMAPDSQEYEELVDRYAFDGLTIGQIESWIEEQGAARQTRFEPRPDEVYVEYKFEEKSSRSYQVDATGNLAEEGVFTILGYAIPSSLHAGKEIEFEKGDTVLVDQFTADGYQRADQTQVPPFRQVEVNVTEVSRRFFRTLNDYPFALKDLNTQTTNLADETGMLQGQNDVTREALDDSQSQIQIRDGDINKLTQDQQNLQKDVDTIQALLDARTVELQGIKQRIEMLERQIRNRQARITASTRALRRQPADTSVVGSSR